MAATVWLGRITFGLVSIPVRLFTATESHDISFHYLHAADSSRIGMQYYCRKDGKVVSRDELVKGYEYKKGEFVLIDPEELEQIQPQSSSNLNIDQFIQLEEVDPVYFERSYYVAPAEEGTEKAYSLFMDALKQTSRAGIGKLLMRDREYLALVRPGEKGLVLETMHFPDEIKETPAKNTNTKVSEKEKQLATMLVENLTEPFDPSRYKDEYVERVEELIQAKIKGKKVRMFREKPVKTVPNLLEALQQSLKQTGKRPQATATRSNPPELPLENYDDLTIDEIRKEVDSLSDTEIRRLREYERKHKNRKSLLKELKATA